MENIYLLKSKNFKETYYMTNVIIDENKAAYMISMLVKRNEIKDIINKTLEEVEETHIYMITPLIIQNDLNWVDHLDIHKKTINELFFTLSDEKTNILKNTIVKIKDDVKKQKFNESQDMIISYPIKITEYLINKINDKLLEEVEEIITDYKDSKEIVPEINEEELYTQEMIEEVTDLSHRLEEDYVTSINENFFASIDVKEL